MAHTQNLGVQGLEDRLVFLEGLKLMRSARGVVFRIESQDDALLASKINKVNGLTLMGGENERRRGISNRGFGRRIKQNVFLLEGRAG
jgi:hypothetical protein